MSNPRHQGDTKTFRELTFVEQSKSINPSILYLNKAIKLHIYSSPVPQKTHKECLAQLQRLIKRLELNAPE